MIKALLRALVVLVCLLGITASPVSAQTPAVPSDKLGWSQSADDITKFGFVLVVDGQRQSSQMTGVTCVSASGAYTCTAPLPALTPGNHTLALIAVRTDGTLVAESQPSSPLAITIVVVTAPAGLKIVR